MNDRSLLSAPQLMAILMILGVLMGCSSAGDTGGGQKRSARPDATVPKTNRVELSKQIQAAVNRDIALTQALMTYKGAGEGLNLLDSAIAFYTRNLEDRKEIVYGLGYLRNTVQNSELDTAVAFFKEENSYVEISIESFQARKLAMRAYYAIGGYSSAEAPGRWRDFHEAENAYYQAARARQSAFEHLQISEENMIQWGWPRLYKASVHTGSK